ncbi:MAG: helix-turn-helix transcriptional regulator [Candidatus Omnitrophica bacterium]|nr:helix-turn-helix transcriptional regulator [Candidatus Omnitrophota bacterium]
MYQEDLAKAIGVDEMSIVNWEKDRHRPAKSSIKKLSAFFRVIL